MEWTLKWPDAPGYYWFYGWTAWMRDTEPGLSIVYAHDAGDHIVPVCRGQILYQAEKAYGMWSFIELPELPPIPPEDMVISPDYTYHTEREK